MMLQVESISTTYCTIYTATLAVWGMYIYILPKTISAVAFPVTVVTTAISV